MENCINPPAFVASDFICHGHGHGNHTLLKINTPEPEWWDMAGVRFALKAHFSSNLAENMLDLTSDNFAAGNSQDLGIHVFFPQLQFTLTDCTVCICLQFRAIPLLIMILHHVSE